MLIGSLSDGYIDRAYRFGSIKAHWFFEIHKMCRYVHHATINVYHTSGKEEEEVDLIHFCNCFFHSIYPLECKPPLGRRLTTN